MPPANPAPNAGTAAAQLSQAAQALGAVPALIASALNQATGQAPTSALPPGASTYSGLPGSPLYNKMRQQAQAANPPVLAQLAPTAVPQMFNYANAVRQATAMSSQLAGSTTDVNKQLATTDQQARAVARAYAYASAGLLAWVGAGLRGTTQGAMLSYQVQQLSRQVANLFLPAIEAVTRKLQEAVNWFRGLSGAQQESIGRWLAIGTGMLGVLALAPRLVAAFQMISAVMNAGLLANPFLLATAGVVALLASTESGRASLLEMGKALWQAFRPIAETLAGALVPAIQGLAEGLAGLVRLAMDLAGAFDSVTRALAGVSGSSVVVDALGAGFSAVLGPVSKLFGLIGDVTRATVGGPGSAIAGALGGGGRHDVVTSRTGTEDPRETIRRLEDAVLKTGAEASARKTAEATEKTAQDVGFIRGVLERLGQHDHRPKPLNED
jgi:hypothetical protein